MNRLYLGLFGLQASLHDVLCLTHSGSWLCGRHGAGGRGCLGRYADGDQQGNGKGELHLEELSGGIVACVQEGELICELEGRTFLTKGSLEVKRNKGKDASDTGVLYELTAPRRQTKLSY